MCLCVCVCVTGGCWNERWREERTFLNSRLCWVLWVFVTYGEALLMLEAEQHGRGKIKAVQCYKGWLQIQLR